MWDSSAAVNPWGAWLVNETIRTTAIANITDVFGITWTQTAALVPCARADSGLPRCTHQRHRVAMLMSLGQDGNPDRYTLWIGEQ